MHAAVPPVPVAALATTAKPPPRRTLFAEVPDVEAVAEETSATETNRMLRAGWRLLQVIHAHDGGGGYPVYVVGRLRHDKLQTSASSHSTEG